MNETAARMYAQKVPCAKTKVRVGVGVVVKNADGQVLLEKRSDCHMWGLPGGKIEPGESIEAAAVREVFEETGLQVAIVDLLGVYSLPEGRIVTFLDNGDVVHLIDVLLEANIISGTLRKSDESEALAFFGLSALPDDIVPPALQPLKDLKNQKKAVIR